MALIGFGWIWREFVLCHVCAMRNRAVREARLEWPVNAAEAIRISNGDLIQRAVDLPFSARLPTASVDFHGHTVSRCDETM